MTARLRRPARFVVFPGRGAARRLPGTGHSSRSGGSGRDRECLWRRLRPGGAGSAHRRTSARSGTVAHLATAARAYTLVRHAARNTGQRRDSVQRSGARLDRTLPTRRAASGGPGSAQPRAIPGPVLRYPQLHVSRRLPPVPAAVAGRPEHSLHPRSNCTRANAPAPLGSIAAKTKESAPGRIGVRAHHDRKNVASQSEVQKITCIVLKD